MKHSVERVSEGLKKMVSNKTYKNWDIYHYIMPLDMYPWRNFSQQHWKLLIFLTFCSYRHKSPLFLIFSEIQLQLKFQSSFTEHKEW